MSEQDASLNFKSQKTTIRNVNKILYKKDVTDSNDKPYENIYRNDDVLREIIKNNKSSYSSQKIFNYENPSIKSIIDIYTNKRTLVIESSSTAGTESTIDIEPVSDFKLFYLFSNNTMEKKCAHQWKLISNTMSFIDAIHNHL